MPKNPSISASEIRKFIKSQSDIDVIRIHYCYQIGSTFVNLSLMETTIIEGMTVCDRISVKSLLGDDAPAWDVILEKSGVLKDSTLGSLIKILSKHGINDNDISYLRWVKEKRDFFIHRYFHDNQWPGSMNAEEISIAVRKLLYLEIIFSRVGQRLWKIFTRAGLMMSIDMGESGHLLYNPDSFPFGTEK
ncbi:hypothetical protein M2360_004067 [Rhizobium sp. SG_E_25_P2]|uniref:hypothetical protein n=1 Tax=Rhizobium sp. SG_E_25_P2 TaxID=2879942 RepID=UPI00247416A2|nr:hypothetical protein [Rhizobium sp. SG_E_25_P2]MDH6268660.1 hypothetical protein [Rhizobium sp. SG_E_25_P2]